MQFSEDNQLLLTLTGGPDWTLQCWNWSKAKIVASISTSNGMPMTKCSFSPTDASVACCSGKDTMKFFRISDREVRVLHEFSLEATNFTCHIWLRVPEDFMVASTDTGDLLVFRSGEYVCHLGASPGSSCPIYTMLPMSQGFMAGSSAGSFLFFTYCGETDGSSFGPDSFILENQWATELTQGSVIALSICPSEDLICAITSDNQLLHMSGLSPLTLTVDSVKYVTCSFHGQKAITGMDVCYRKPLVVTCSRDQTLRIWNFQTMELELNKVFPEDMFCCALHPSGLHVAVGFADKLRLFHILVDELRPAVELPIKNCREAKFSWGGNMLAAANGNSINVFDFYTGEKVADLRGHNGKVRSIYWLESGSQLLSCGHDGAVYIWDIDGCKRTGEYVHKGTMYTSAVCVGDTVFVVGSDGKYGILKELELPDLSLTKELDGGGALLNMVCLSVAKSVLFAGTGDPGKPGMVRAYAYPVTGDYLEYTCMSSALCRMCLTPDQGYLIAADEAGCICIFELKDRSERYQRSSATDGTQSSAADWVDEALVTRAELEDRNQIVMELKTKVEELKLNNEYQIKLKDMNYSERIKEVTDKFAQELEQAKSKFEILKEERADSEFEYVQRLKQKEEKHQHDMQETETEFQTRIMEEVEKYQHLVRMRDAQIERLTGQRQILIETHERYVEELSSDFERKIDEDRQLRLQLDDEKTELLKELTEIQHQLEDDVDTEIENIRFQYEEKLKTSREATLKYKGENGIMRKKFAVLQKEIEDQKEEIKALFDKERELHEQVKVLEKEVSAHKREIKNRDVSIGEKEKRIYELKKKNQELDKFKFVLDFKIRELKRQVEPRQAEIAGMKDQIKEMDAELERYHKSNAGLDEMIGSLRGRIDEIQSEIVSKRMKATQLEHLNAGFKGDLQRAVTLILNPDDLLEAITKLVNDYGSQETMKPRVDPDVEKEYVRHKQFLLRSVAQLKKTLHEETEAHSLTNSSLRKSNMDLISEINAQREKNKLLKQSVQADLGKLQHMARSGHGKKSGPTTGILALEAVLEKGLKSSSGTAPAEAGNDTSALESLDRNRRKIALLRERINDLEGRVVSNRAYSREVLPPMDGVAMRGEMA
jgi:cilia- and flagella-associated protein 57